MLWRVRVAKLDERDNGTGTAKYMREGAQDAKSSDGLIARNNVSEAKLTELDSIALAELSVGDR